MKVNLETIIRIIPSHWKLGGFVVSIILCYTAPVEAACHKYSVWHYNFPQPCSRTFQPRQTVAVLPPERIVPNQEHAQERIEVTLPNLDDIVWGQWGDDQLRALALL